MVQLSPDQWDTLLGTPAPAAPYAPYGLDEWGNPLPAPAPPPIPSAIQTTAPVAAQAQQDYSQALATAFDWTPQTSYLPPEISHQGLSTGQPTYAPPADPTQQFLPPESLAPYEYTQAQNAANLQIDPSFNWAPAPDLQQLSADWGENAYLADEWRRLQEVIPQGGIGQPIGAAGRDLAGKALSADIPVLSPFLRNVVEPAAAWAAANDPGMGPAAARGLYNLLPGDDMSRQEYGKTAANFVVPNTALDVALTAAPVAGKVLKGLPRGLGATLGPQGQGDDVLGKVLAKGAGDESSLDDLLQQSIDALKANPKAKLASQVPVTGTGPKVSQAFGDDLMKAVDLERQAAWRAAGGVEARAAQQHLDEIIPRSGATPPTSAIDDAIPPAGAPPAPPSGPPRQPPEGPGPMPEYPNGGQQGGLLDDPLAPSKWDRFKENIGAIPAAWKGHQASQDIFGGKFRQGWTSWFIEPRSAPVGMKKGGQAYLTNPDNYDIVQHMQDIPLFNGGTLHVGASAPAQDLATGALKNLGEKTIVIKPWKDVVGLERFQTPGFEKLNNSWVQQMSERVPLRLRSENSLKAIMTADAADQRARWVTNAAKHGITDQSQYALYDDIARVWNGMGDVPEILRHISTSFYSLQNLTARAQTFTKPFTMKNAGNVFAGNTKVPNPLRMAQEGAIFSASPRGVATRNLVRFAGGELANLRMLSAVGKTTGMFDVGWNPLDTGFGRMEWEDDKGNTFSTDLLGGYGSMIKYVTRSADAAKSGDLSTVGAESIKFFRNKQAPASSVLFDTIVENTSLKDDPAFQSPFSRNWLDPKTYMSGAFAEKILPFWMGDSVQSLIDGVKDVRSPQDLMELGMLSTGQFLGAPVSLYPASPNESLEAAANKLGPAIPWGEMGNAERAQFIKDNPSLKPLYDKQQAAREGRSVEITDWKYEKLNEVANLAKTDPAKYRELAGGIVRESAIKQEEARANGKIDDFEPKSAIDKAVDAYYESIKPAREGLQPDYNLQEKLGADYLASLDPAMRERVIAELAYSKDPVYAELLRDRQTLAPYFDQRDQAWSMITAAEPTLAGFRTFDDFRQDAVEGFRATGLNNAEAEAMAEKYTAIYSKFMTAQAKSYLTQSEANFALLKILDKWGYNIPAEFRAYAR